MTVTHETSTRDRLLHSARDLLAGEGVGTIGLRAIARNAGVSHAAPRRYFETLSSLLTAVSIDGHRDLYAAVERAVDATGPTASASERLAAAAHGYVEMALDQPGVFAVMFRPDMIDPDDEVCREAGLRGFGQLADLVAAAQGDGWHPDEDTDELALVTWALIHGLCELWTSTPLGQDPNGIQRLVTAATRIHLALPTN